MAASRTFCANGWRSAVGEQDRCGSHGCCWFSIGLRHHSSGWFQLGANGLPRSEGLPVILVFSFFCWLRLPRPSLFQFLPLSVRFPGLHGGRSPSRRAAFFSTSFISSRESVWARGGWIAAFSPAAENWHSGGHRIS